MALTASVKNLRDAWHLMNGIVCIYKPSDLSFSRVRHTLISNICRGENYYSQTALNNNIYYSCFIQSHRYAEF
jgi:hypothetical protein